MLGEEKSRVAQILSRLLTGPSTESTTQRLRTVTTPSYPLAPACITQTKLPIRRFGVEEDWLKMADLLLCGGMPTDVSDTMDKSSMDEPSTVSHDGNDIESTTPDNNSSHLIAMATDLASTPGARLPRRPLPLEIFFPAREAPLEPHLLSPQADVFTLERFLFDFRAIMCPAEARHELTDNETLQQLERHYEDQTRAASLVPPPVVFFSCRVTFRELSRGQQRLVAAMRCELMACRLAGAGQNLECIPAAKLYLRSEGEEPLDILPSQMKTIIMALRNVSAYHPSSGTRGEATSLLRRLQDLWLETNFQRTRNWSRTTLDFKRFARLAPNERKSMIESAEIVVSIIGVYIEVEWYFWNSDSRWLSQQSKAHRVLHGLVRVDRIVQTYGAYEGSSQPIQHWESEREIEFDAEDRRLPAPGGGIPWKCRVVCSSTQYTLPVTFNHLPRPEVSSTYRPSAISGKEFLDLPTEIRLRILEHHFADRSGISTSANSMVTMHKEDRSCLMLNRQIRAEGLTVFYAARSYRFRVQRSSMNRRRYEIALPLFRVRRHIRRMHLDLLAPSLENTDWLAPLIHLGTDSKTGYGFGRLSTLDITFSGAQAWIDDPWTIKGDCSRAKKEFLALVLPQLQGLRIPVKALKIGKLGHHCQGNGCALADVPKIIEEALVLS
ncbi:hypothetical protein BJ546DRAFT_251658 [Cryomyces antarcticus]